MRRSSGYGGGGYVLVCVLCVIALIATTTSAAAVSGTLQGRVVDGAGAPIAGATVYVSPVSSSIATATAVTGTDGVFRIPNLPTLSCQPTDAAPAPCNYQLEVQIGGSAWPPKGVGGDLWPPIGFAFTPTSEGQLVNLGDVTRPPQRWWAEYNFQLWRQVTGNQASGDLQFNTGWTFQVQKSGGNPLDWKVAVSTNVAGVMRPPYARPLCDSSSPNYLWCGTLEAGATYINQAPWLQDSSSLTAPYPLGYTVTQASSPAADVPLGPNETQVRTFHLTLMTEDPELFWIHSQLGPYLSQSGPYKPIAVSDFSCSAEAGNGLVTVFGPVGDIRANWSIRPTELGGTIPAGSTYTLTCQVTLTNQSASPAIYGMYFDVGGRQRLAPDQSSVGTTSVTVTTPDSVVLPGNPAVQDLLGETVFTIKEDPSTVFEAGRNRNLDRRLVFAGVNRIVDVVAPTTTAITYVSMPPQPTPLNRWVNNPSPMVFLNATDGPTPGSSGVAKIHYSVNEGPWLEKTGMSASIPLPSPPATPPDGIYTMHWWAEDVAGNREAEQSAWLGIDATRPVTTASVSPAPTATGWNNGPVTVTLNAVDAGSGVKALDYYLDFGGVITGPYTIPGSTATIDIQNPGLTRIAYRARDNVQNGERFIYLDVKIDSVAPTIGCSVSPTLLWPPNHKMVAVTASVQVTDQDSGVDGAGFTLLSVTSNEPDNGLGDGDTQNDVQGFVVGTPDLAGTLRAERSGKGASRVYSLLFGGSDRAGNPVRCTAVVTVPHDMGETK
jgi:hypothetical protein